MMKREAKFQTEFSRWLKYNWAHTSAFELKVATKGSLAFDAVKPHQINGLLQVKNQLIYKIPDDTRTQKPFDCFKIIDGEGYVVVYFDKPRNKEFFIITIEHWIEEVATSKRKSLTEDRARTIAWIVGELK